MEPKLTEEEMAILQAIADAGGSIPLGELWKRLNQEDTALKDSAMTPGEALGKLWELAERHALNLTLTRYYDDATQEWTCTVKAETGRDEIPYGIKVAVWWNGEERLVETIGRASHQIEEAAP